MANTFTTVDAYIASFPPDIQMSLDDVRQAIHEVAPKATECISYGLPAFKYKDEPLIYFGGFKSHVGVYGTPVTHEAFKDKLAAYKQGRGSVQFPLDKPLPLRLIKQMVQFKMKELKKSHKR